MHTAQRLEYEKLFGALPERYGVISAHVPYVFLAVNDAYSQLNNMTPDEMIGKNLFDLFPDTSNRARINGKSEVEASLERCIATKKPDPIGTVRYDVASPSGKMQVRYWQTTHYPLLGNNNEVYAIVQSTNDVTDTVQASEQMELSQLQLHDVLSAGLIGSWILDLNTNTVVASEGLAKIFGVTLKDISDGVPLDFFTHFIDERDHERVLSELSLAVSECEEFRSEFRITTRQNNERWIIARGKVERDQDGTPIRLPGVVVDITDRKAIESRLQESEERLRFMADSMPQLVWITRPDGYHEYFNAQWYAYTGTKPGESDNQRWHNLFHEDDRVAARKAWKHSLKTGEQYEVEYRLYHAESNTYRWVIGRALPFRDHTGKILKWHGTCTDINDQKYNSYVQTFLSDVSKELSISLDYTKMLKKVTELCIPNIADWCTVDLYDEEKGWDQVSVAHIDPNKVSVAKEYRKQNPVNIDDPTGLPKVVRTGKVEFYPYIDNALLETYLEPGEKLEFMKSLNLKSIIIAPLSIQGVTTGAISFISSDSGRYYTEADVTMAKQLAGRISLSMTNATLYSNSMHEIKVRKKLEKELLLEKDTLESRVKNRTRQLQETNEGLEKEILHRQKIELELHEKSKNLIRSNQELQDFAYVASHDLQEPLRKIQAFSNLLESEYSQKLGEGSDYLHRMRAAAARMGTLIEDLLEFSRVSTKSKLSVPIELSSVVTDVINDLESRIADTKGKVIVHDLPIIKADPTHMRQLFQNLIGNALKFHQPGIPPIVEVSSSIIKDKKGYYEIRVTDNGIGFDEKYLDRIFSVFQRLHGRDEYEGTGIGLAVCRKIVERYGGTITAESKKNEGSTFIIVLPQKSRSSI